MTTIALHPVARISRPAASRRRPARMVRLRRHTTIDGVTYKVAENFAERRAAFELVHTAYSQHGLMDANGWGLRLSARHLLPESAVFVACDGDTVISTLSLLSGRGMGLLLEQEFGYEVEQLHNEGLQVAEISSLASRKRYFSQKKMFGVFLNLIGLMYSYARFNEIERLLIAVHPKHARFYVRFLGFEQFGAQRSYARVHGQPAVACVHDSARFDEESCPLKQHLDGMRFQGWELAPRPIPESERGYFAAAWHSLSQSAAA